MSELYKDNDLLLDETLSTPRMLWWLLGILGGSALIGALSGSKGQLDGVVLLIVAVTVLFIGAIFLAEYFLYLRRMRVKMDATRVWTHIPLTKDRSLEWSDIRTAAVVRLKNMNYPPMIVLSIHAPADALTRKRMVWKNPRRGQELRIPLTDTRRAVVEKQLGMTLPDITL